MLNFGSIFHSHGVHFFAPGTTGNLIQGNFIGTDVSGAVGLGNVNDGVEIRESQGNTIGGLSTAARNIISGNQGDGVLLTLGFLWVRHGYWGMPLGDNTFLSLWPVWFPPAFYVGAYGYLRFLIFRAGNNV